MNILDFILGPRLTLWKVTVGKRQYGHLCKNYWEFWTMLTDATKKGLLPKGDIVVKQVCGRYYAPRPLKPLEVRPKRRRGSGEHLRKRRKRR